MKIRTTPAAYDQLCTCGRMILVGDQVHAWPAGDRTLWLHAECARTAARAAGHADVQLVAGQARGLARAAERRADGPKLDSHRRVNGSHLRCCRCGRRLILGRDDAPVRTPDGRRWLHARCA